jgi:hypothetical protein
MATHLKALREGLVCYSTARKKEVKGCKLLKRRTPLSALDIKRLARAVGIVCSGAQAVDVVERSIIIAP